MSSYDAELKACRDAALAAGKIHLEYRDNLPEVQIKNDASPVTEVDRKCESVIHGMLAKQFPRDGFLGEETGEEKGQSGRTWIVDPLDGTRPYLRKIPTHSVLIALEDGNELVCGCIHLPAMAETFWAKKDGGAYLNKRRISVSKTKELPRAMGSGIGFIEKASSREAEKLLALMKRWDYAYGFMDAYSYGGVACGRLDLCANLVDKPWDCAAAACIITEAGGKFSDINGKPSIYNGSFVCSNGLVHEAVLEYFH
ncbi:MAG TPA: inositol monophosphatase [Chitinivibrionales bacterium]|nr:inositol monophosphatase [Chitinivibrionales bacterium]